MRTYDFVLLGGGAASVSAARALRRENSDASIALLGAETALPYSRPPLTKDFLNGALSGLQLALHPFEFYEAQRIELMTGAQAMRVEPETHIVSLANGRRVGYGKLLIATGASPQRPLLPGHQLRGIQFIHDIADAAALREAAGMARRAVVLGAGFVGIEVAAALRAAGLEVTLLERTAQVMPQLHSEVLSAWFANRCAEQGVRVLTGCTVTRFLGNSHVTGALTQTGLQLDCELVVVAIGVSPNCSFLEGSGIELGDGVLVDEFLRTSDPDIYAAGDVANFYDPVFAVRRRIEHWDNALRQGRVAARNMLGNGVPYRDVSIFYGNAFGTTYTFMGYAEPANETETETETVERGARSDGAWSVLYLRHNILRAVFSVGRSAEEAAAAEELIRHRVGLHAARARLADRAFSLTNLPTQTVLILQGGGALGAFECGAIQTLEESGVRPDVISAVSIGAFNGAIVASHPGKAAEPLAQFWRDLSIGLPGRAASAAHEMLVLWHTLWFGIPNFLRPRWWNGELGAYALPWCWTSYYDPSAIKTLIRRYVDFDSLARSPTRLLIGAVDVETGEQKIFDSYVDRLSPDHLLASGSLPPAMPWTTIDGHTYWDGGIVSNSPLELVIERCGRIGARVFALDLFSGGRPLPSNLIDVMRRRDEIVYTDRTRNDLRFEEYANDFSDLVLELLREVDAGTARRFQQRPNYIRLMGNRTPIHLSRISLRDELPFAADFDFSAGTIEALQRRGREAARHALDESHG
ncbi:pyridine nucleotide-disulfide oxidoreductase [Paraburkholderia sp. UYCP14C]|uniref:FAD-dependent oxidoreductase n=1 Tax=Paraburkholderia sp. UYCP14C TaxID=2511130 RepID=UPI0010216C9C|nr:FAD-dependent oxidoreductase [Paraburkholderia sp. UYCP14C]RZF24543.1 pyridine nucleotide-disulfide oxidoreductase [Paraburkholderia sp. UYCP14C]